MSIDWYRVVGMLLYLASLVVTAVVIYIALVVVIASFG